MTTTQYTNSWTGTMMHAEHVYQKEYRLLRERSYETLLQCCKTNDVEGFRNTINDLQFRNGEIVMECVPKLRKLGYNINKSNQLNVVKTQGDNNMFTDEERNDAIDKIAYSAKDQRIKDLEERLKREREEKEQLRNEKDREIKKLRKAANQYTESEEVIKAKKIRSIFENTKIAEQFPDRKLAILHDDICAIRGRSLKKSNLRVSTDLPIDDICKTFRKMAKFDECELELLRQIVK